MNTILLAYDDTSSGNKKTATGDELKTFGSIWHIVKG